MPGNKKLLVIDDDEDIREGIRNFALLLKLDPILVGSGVSGLEILKNDPDYFCIVLDRFLKDFDGEEMIRIIRQLLFISVPIVFISGAFLYSDKIKIEKQYENVVVLAKPFSLTEFSQAVLLHQ